MKKEQLVLAIDFGTQSIRAAIVNQKGDILALVKDKYDEPYFSTHPGWAEQQPEYYWQKMVQATKQLAKDYPELLKRALAFTITTFRDSPVFLDENFAPTRPMVLWLDQRQAAIHKKLPLFRRIIFGIVGMTETIKLNMKRTPGIWVQENEPEVWAKTRYYMNFSTYITYRLLGKYIDSVPNQTGHFPIRFRSGKWYGDNAMKNIFQIPVDKLCEIVPPGSLMGEISAAVSKETGLPEGLKMYAAGTDKGSESIGTGCYSNDYAAISYGTASVITVANKRYVEPETFLPAYATPIPDLFHSEVQIYRGYWTVNWFIEEIATNESLEAKIELLATEEVLNKKMLEISPGANGLVLQPYWGPTLKRPEARGAIIGFSDFHTRIHIYRALIEGIAFALYEGLQSIEERQRKRVKEIRVSGGGSQSDAICQITADIFGIPVKRTQTYETAVIGTAMATMLYLNVYNSLEEATKNMVHIEKTFVPNQDNHTKYAYLFKSVYRELYPRLSTVYKRLKKFQ